MIRAPRLLRAGAGCILGGLIAGCGSSGDAGGSSTWTLTVQSSSPSSGVPIGLSPADVSGAGGGVTGFSRTYAPGARVTLTAPAASGGNGFTSWSGCTSAQTTSCTVSLSADTTVTANYAAPKARPAVTATPASPSIAAADSLPVKITVSGGGGPAPTGSVTLAGGGYTSAAATLSPGSATTGSVTITVPAGSLAAGSDTLTATYTPDAAASTAYTSASGAATVTVAGGVSGTISVDASTSIAPISARQLGMNLGFWGADVTGTSPSTFNEVESAGARFLRWPGGSASDTYHWAGQAPYVTPEVHSACSITDSSTSPYTYAVSSPAWMPDNTWSNFQSYIARPGGYETAVTLDYGTDAACNGPGDPAEAAAWVAYARAGQSRVTYWTVGNEQYGSWEDDLHPYPASDDCGGTGCHRGSVYVDAMNGPSGYYQQIKNADPDAQVGAVVEVGLAGEGDGGLAYPDGWDAAVLGCASVAGPASCSAMTTGASFDFVEMHWYAQQPGEESDSYLLGQAITDFDTSVSQLRDELAATGHPNTPIMLGEFNSVADNPGRQSMSIVNALFLGMMYGEVLARKVDIAAMWFGAGGGQSCNQNNSDSLYGWQNFGGYDAVATSTADDWNYCTSSTGTTIVPEGAVLPNGRAIGLVTQFAGDGEHLLGTTVDATLPNIRAYSATHGSGYNLLLFNLDENSTTGVTVKIANASGSSYNASATTYGRAQYDDSRSNVWTGPVSQSLGPAGPGAITLSLPPWSMTVLALE